MNPQIIKAIEDGDLDLLKDRIKHVVDINEKKKYTYTNLGYYLRRAVRYSRGCEREFVESGEDNREDISYEMAKVIIDHGADVNFKDGIGRTPLHYCFNRHDNPNKMMELLVNNGADVNQEDICWGKKTPFLIGIVHNTDQSIAFSQTMFMIEHGRAIVNHVIPHGKYPDRKFPINELMKNMNAEKIPVLTCLLEHGADPHSRDIDSNDGFTALLSDVNSQCVITTLQLFLKYGGCVKHSTQYYHCDPPLFHAAERFRHSEYLQIIQFLVEQGADVNFHSEGNWRLRDHFEGNYYIQLQTQLDGSLTDYTRWPMLSVIAQAIVYLREKGLVWTEEEQKRKNNYLLSCKDETTQLSGEKRKSL